MLTYIDTKLRAAIPGGGVYSHQTQISRGHVDRASALVPRLLLAVHPRLHTATGTV